jgi:4-amino-4-deoxy-L-arabinose transferase-like glycosyltransferase
MSRRALVIAGGVSALLIAFASGYGYHRDELYFLAAGHHLAWAYADQGPLTPLIARLVSDASVTSLTVLRLPSAIAAGGTVLLTGLLAFELGGSSRAQLIAAGSAACAPLVLFTGHLLSTSTFDLLAWTAVTWLVVRAVRVGDDRLLLVAGVVLGVALLNKPLPAFLGVGLLAGVAIAGPRRLLRSPYAWGGAAIALALWSPWIAWQAAHGWPQIDVSSSIAAGNSTSSAPRWALVPLALLQPGLVAAPVGIAGLARLFRDPSLRWLRFFAWTWVVLAVVFVAAGGKPYYLGGLMPLMLAAGAGWVDSWLERGRAGARKAVLASGFAIIAALTAIVSLPLLPPEDAGPVFALNPDAAETVGWPAFARTVAGVYREAPSGAVILTGNYGEAGAIDRYGPGLGLPSAYSGHNAFWYWGPPPRRRAPVVAVGLDRGDRTTQLRDCSPAARVDNESGVDNDEQGVWVFLCRGPRRPWAQEWPALKQLG